MSEKWACDFPGCTNLMSADQESGVSRELWCRIEKFDQSFYWLMALPLIGNGVALLCAANSERKDALVAHLCPAHNKAIFKKEPPR
jgi:hypothetical protein